YPDDMITDQIEQFIVAEIIREKIFYLTREEIPYGVAVVIEEMKERENGLFYIRAYIYVEKKSHKGIVIGKNGKKLKQIGLQARQDIEKLLQTEVYIDLWVKILKDWREKDNLVKRMGYKD
ncbi:MAG: GTPase Era, partial [Bacillota bacterium]